MAKTDSDTNRIITYFKSRDEVSALYLFGSAASGRSIKDSDIDIAVLINEKRLEKTTFDNLLKMTTMMHHPIFLSVRLI